MSDILDARRAVIIRWVKKKFKGGGTGDQVLEFSDMDGKVILKKVQFSAAADNGYDSSHAGWLNTYYIYDDQGCLRCVIQTGEVELVSALNLVLSDLTSLSQQCFRYAYDKRGRMIVKKLPGAGDVWMVYDARDRIVLTQEAEMCAGKKWLYSLYDELNRPVKTGLMTANTNNLTSVLMMYR